MSDYTPKAMASRPPDFSDTLLDVIETFLDGVPALEEANVRATLFTEHTGGGLNPRKMCVFIDGVQYNVTVKREA